MRAAARPTPLLLALLLALPALGPLAGPALAAAAPALETLQNGSLEGAPDAANGFALHHEGAQQALVARTGLASVDLAKGGATPGAGGVLGAVEAFATHPVPVPQLKGLALHRHAPRGASLDLAILLRADLDGDGQPDRCLVHEIPGPLPEDSAWTALALGGDAPLREADAACAGGATRLLSAVAADPAWAAATVRALAVESRTAAPGPWPAGTPVYVDDLSLLATSSPLVRIREAALNLCGGASFATIRDALPCAAEGATLLVAPGTYEGGLVLDRRVTLCAAPAGATACDASQAATTVIRGGGAHVVQLLADGAVLDGFTLQNPDFTATDSATAAAEPSLVLVQADGAKVLNNRLSQAAGPLPPGASRQSTSAIRVAAGSDGVEVRGNRVESMPPSTWTEAGCVRAPCRTYGLRHDGGADLLAAQNRFDMKGAGHADAIRLAGPSARVEDNVLLLGASTTSAPTAGVRADAALEGPRLARNEIRAADAEPAASLVGVQAPLRNATLEGNAFRGLGEAVQLLDGSGGALRVRGSLLRDVGASLRLAPGTAGLAVDARENDWGAHSAAAIRATLRDEGAGNAVDVACYVDADGASLVCPPAAGFTLSTLSPSWRRPVRFDDASVALGRPIASWAWTFSDGATAAGASVEHAFAQPGPASATLTVTDEDGFAATLTRAFEVVNRAPVLGPVGDRVVAETQTLFVNLTATDADGDALAFSAEGLPAGAAFDAATGKLQWTPGLDAEGNHTLTFRASDGLLSDEETITVTVGHANAPPLLALEGSFSGREGSAFGFRAYASDPDGTRPNLVAFVLPPGATFQTFPNGTGVFSWTPTHDQAGDYFLVVSADDGAAAARHELVLRVENVNRPPALAPVPNKLVAEAATLEFFLTASDPDGSQGLALSMGPAPRRATFDAARGKFSWTPDYEQAGRYAIDFRVSDGEAVASVRVLVEVAQTNRAPDVSPLPDRSVKANRELRVPIFAVDPDKDSLTFAVSPMLPGMSIADAVLRWRPAPGHVGTHLLTIVGSDGRLTDASPFRVTVEENLPPQASLAGPAQADVGAPAAFRASAVDPDGSGPLRYEWDFDARDGFQAEATGAEVAPAFARIGPHVVTLRVLDADGMETVKTFEVDVDDVVHLHAAVLGGAGARDDRTGVVRLTDWTGAPLAGQRVDVATWYHPDGRANPVPLRRFSVETDAHGRAVFGLPKDLSGVADVPGRHVLVASALVEGTYLGDAEQAEAQAAYGGLL